MTRLRWGSILLRSREQGGRAAGLALCHGQPFGFVSCRPVGVSVGCAAMAKAKEEFGASSSLEDELSCSICLSLYRNPVSLCCGHSFCKQCVQKVLSAQQQDKAPYSCPLCRVELGPIVELQNNFHLCSIVETYVAHKGKQDEGFATEKGEAVPCDFCLDKPQPAVKTCLMCDASLCQAHLDKHSARASHRDHVLVEVGTGGSMEERRCQEHGKVLEYFCQDERLFICVLCSIAGCHKGHKILTLKEAHDMNLDELSHTMDKLLRYINYLSIALEELQRNKNQIETNTKTATSLLQKMFGEIETEIKKKEKKILSDIQSSEKSQLAECAKRKKEMEEKRDELVQHLQSLQKIKEQPNTFHLFKEFRLVLDSISSREFRICPKMDVSVVELNEATISSFQTLMGDCSSCLDTYLQGLLTNQIKWNSEDPAAGSSSNDKFGKMKRK
ncbi:E3 ubiquitin/ISG15 ligase TRIM25-like isoform X2 [Phasianus colchicus]|uniref:E3 ubiquitin/ISG15 ligase TRIM25-like isoform X2 n=1 Tax=Phasianus colchicus TaxID=9054 RepID=UPI00129D767F|nr:E3 ubiquitin/ISG15 ligase TRIM25-like isoform X2 [Phasianus colchicus]